MDKEEKLEKLTVRVSKEKKAMMLKALGKSSYDSLSDFMRAGIDKELNVQMYKDSLDFIIKELDTMIDAKLAPLIKAERKLSAKNLRTSAINTYLLGEVLCRLLGDDMHKQFIDMLTKARNKANYYINRDTENMSKQDLFDFYSIGEMYRNE
ncbi:MAG: hypothetical protein IJJ82_05935 [Clostridia bacterium]|nr:hypothetical protein [Clostridia bacterium]